MKKHICFIYLFLWCIYYLQGVVYASGGLISRVLLLILLLITVYYFFYAHEKYRLPKVLSVLSILVLIWTLYGGAYILTGSSGRSYLYLKKIYISLLPVFPIYVFTKQGKLTLPILQKWGVVFLVMCILQYYRYRSEELGLIYGETDIGDELTNNAGYTMLSLIPLIPVYNKKPLLQYVLIGIISYFVISSMKRGAILIAAISFIWFIYISYKTNRLSSKQIWRGLLLIVLLVAGFFVVQNLLLTSDYFNYRIEQTREGNSSARDIIYGKFFNYFIYENDVATFLFGNGADFTRKHLGTFAHNDWLEIAINNGLWMVIIYLVYWIRFAGTVKRYKKNTLLFQIVGLFFLNYFLRTIISMSYSSVLVYASVPLGYALAFYGGNSIAPLDENINNQQ